MYRITCDGITLYEPDNPVLQLISGTLKTGQNIAGTLTFVLAPTHPYLSRIKARSSVISVYRDGVLYFRGSPLNVTESDTGLVTVTAEGALAWLGDSVQPFAEYHNMTVRTYLETLVQNHNVAVQDDAYKQFTVGEVTVTDSNDSLYRHSNFEHTKDAITEKLTKRLGGILRVRWKNGVQYLDYLAEYKHVNGQGIKFGQNLLTYARSVPTANLATAIIPLGCKLTDADGSETDERLQIDNGGKNYVWDEKAVQEFGWIFDTIICDDVTLKENLSKRGYLELEARKALPTTIKLTAVDFGALGGNYERITVGDLLPIVSLTGAAGVYGSTIKSYSVSGGGWSSNESTLTTGILQAAGEITFTAVVTDSRGRKASTTRTISVIDYTKPGVAVCDVYRCDADGNRKKAGTYFAVEINASYSAITGNILNITARYKKQSESSYGTAMNVTNNGKTVLGGGNIGASTTYDVLVTVADKYNSLSIPRTLSTKSVLQSFKRSAGAAIGKVAELANWLDIAWHTRVRGTVQADSYTPVNRDDASSNPIVFVPRVTYGTLGLTGSSGSEYFKQWLIWVCKAYPNKHMLLCIGTQHPNSVGIVLCHIYNTSAVNAAGLPEYATGKYFALGGGEIAFGTVDYNFYLK
ncbi:MAG: DUF859 family phage minor structural protein [Hominenteromicrobium sp.]|uniref:DUF859 family phage minor structural protein n=1 Tax=Hominenteromicrobium sp. TaxID=3073581 RepID=UPI0039963B15